MRGLVAALLLLSGCSTPPSPWVQKAKVYFFITADCPIANSFAPEIIRIIHAYGPRGVDFERVYTDYTLTEAAVRKHTEEYGYAGEEAWKPSDARIDKDHSVARAYGVTVTPSAVVVGPDGKWVYRGRIDDRYLAPGQYRLVPTTHELRDALDSVLAGRPVAVSETRAAGCPLTE